MVEFWVCPSCNLVARIFLPQYGLLLGSVPCWAESIILTSMPRKQEDCGNTPENMTYSADRVFSSARNSTSSQSRCIVRQFSCKYLCCVPWYWYRLSTPSALFSAAWHTVDSYVAMKDPLPTQQPTPPRQMPRYQTQLTHVFVYTQIKSGKASTPFRFEDTTSLFLSGSLWLQRLEDRLHGLWRNGEIKVATPVINRRRFAARRGSVHCFSGERSVRCGVTGLSKAKEKSKILRLLPGDKVPQFDDHRRLRKATG